MGDAFYIKEGYMFKSTAINAHGADSGKDYT
jgi:hypothetical protein